MCVDRKQSNQKPIACIVAVSADQGVILVQQHDRSVNKHKFDEFLAELKEKRGDRKSLLVLDNLSVHKCGFSQTRMAHHGFKWHWCVPHWPDGNAVEFCFAIAKRTYKKQKLQLIMEGKEVIPREMIEKAFDSIS